MNWKPYSLFVLLLLAFLVISKASAPYFLERKIGKYLNPPPPHKTDHFDHKIVFVGDSMTEGLGHFDHLRTYLKKYYPDKNFLLLNYGYSATNILSFSERFYQDTQHVGRTFQSINSIDFDVIVIESFAHNPLSDYPLDEGLKKHDQVLDQILETIKTEHPKAKVIFLATIPPHSRFYGYPHIDMTQEIRDKWVFERKTYLQRHIDYANQHQIPIVNVYQSSLRANNEVDLAYINQGDNIHSSDAGLYLISDQIAKFFYQHKIF